MSSTRCFLYVLRLKPGCYYYIGTTLRPFKDRLQEHLDGYGSKWTTKHGVQSVVSVTEIPIAGASQVEDETTIEYMRRHGCQNVRGGKYVRVKDDNETWWLPAEFQPGGVSAYGLYGLEMYCRCWNAECPISCWSSAAVSRSFSLEVVLSTLRIWIPIFLPMYRSVVAEINLSISWRCRRFPRLVLSKYECLSLAARTMGTNLLNTALTASSTTNSIAPRLLTVLWSPM